MAADVARQIRQMVAFIEQEAKEKAEEIDAKAEEEFNIEKGRLVQKQKLAIMSYYAKQEKALELQRQVERSKLQCQARLRVLQAYDDEVRALLDETRQRLADIAASSDYPMFLEDCITEGLCRLLEPSVVVKCLPGDVDTVQSVLPASETRYSELTNGMTCTVSIDSTHLPGAVSGGVELYSEDGKIKVANTLESRLDMVSSQMLPQIRTALFGHNPNRQFND